MNIEDLKIVIQEMLDDAYDEGYAAGYNDKTMEVN